MLAVRQDWLLSKIGSSSAKPTQNQMDKTDHEMLWYYGKNDIAQCQTCISGVNKWNKKLLNDNLFK